MRERRRLVIPVWDFTMGRLPCCTEFTRLSALLGY